MHVDDLRAAIAAGDDQWKFDTSSGDFTAGTDGMGEMTLYPKKLDETELSEQSTGAGNWGTVDYGSDGNSTAELERQIREGIRFEDLAPANGEVLLDNQTEITFLTGDTGISAGMKDALEFILGDERIIPLYDKISGNGNGLTFRIVGFAGIRIVDVNLTGNHKRVIIQPTYVWDPTAVTTPGVGSSYFVGKPVHLSR
jgi:hypothetical protein